ncbi:MAG: hypothetical protein ACFCU4_04615 [Puniceicoccaceae bacterium]
MKTVNSGRITKWIIGSAVFAALPLSAIASFYAEDSFLVGPGHYNGAIPLIGQSPRLPGFDGPWMGAVVGEAVVDPKGLTYPSLRSSGGALAFVSGNNRYGRLLTTPVTDRTQGVFYLSFLMEISVVDGNYQALELHDGGFDDKEDRNFRLGNGGGANGFRDDIFGFRVGNDANEDLGFADSAPNLFVVKFDLTDKPGGDVVTVFRNPTDFRDERRNREVVRLDGQDIRFDRISFAMFTDTPVKFDELRIGSSFQAVLPQR